MLGSTEVTIFGSVAAVVLEYRASGYTVKCVNSLLEQGVERVFLIDNSDDDGKTYAVLESGLAHEQRIHLERSGSNLGFAAGINLGFARAKSEGRFDKVLIINNDALPDPGLVGSLALALDSDPERLIAFPSLRQAGELVHEVYYHRWFATLSSRPQPGAFRLPRGCCMMVAAERMPGPPFDESFFMYGEEIALGWRLHDRPEALCHVSQAIVVHEGSVGSELGSPFYEQRTAAAHILLTSKLARWPGQWILLAMVRMPAILARAMLRSMRAGSLRPLKSLYPALRIAYAASIAPTNTSTVDPVA